MVVFDSKYVYMVAVTHNPMLICKLVPFGFGVCTSFLAADHIVFSLDIDH